MRIFYLFLTLSFVSFAEASFKDYLDDANANSIYGYGVSAIRPVFKGAKSHTMIGEFGEYLQLTVDVKKGGKLASIQDLDRLFRALESSAHKQDTIESEGFAVESSFGFTRVGKQVFARQNVQDALGETIMSEVLSNFTAYDDTTFYRGDPMQGFGAAAPTEYATGTYMAGLIRKSVCYTSSEVPGPDFFGLRFDMQARIKMGEFWSVDFSLKNHYDDPETFMSSSSEFEAAHVHCYAKEPRVSFNMAAFDAPHVRKAFGQKIFDALLEGNATGDKTNALWGELFGMNPPTLNSWFFDGVDAAMRTAKTELEKEEKEKRARIARRDANAAADKKKAAEKAVAEKAAAAKKEYEAKRACVEKRRQACRKEADVAQSKGRMSEADMSAAIKFAATQGQDVGAASAVLNQYGAFLNAIARGVDAKRTRILRRSYDSVYNSQRAFLKKWMVAHTAEVEKIRAAQKAKKSRCERRSAAAAAKSAAEAEERMRAEAVARSKRDACAERARRKAQKEAAAAEKLKKEAAAAKAKADREAAAAKAKADRDAREKSEPEARAAEEAKAATRRVFFEAQERNYQREYYRNSRGWLFGTVVSIDTNGAHLGNGPVSLVPNAHYLLMVNHGLSATAEVGDRIYFKKYKDANPKLSTEAEKKAAKLRSETLRTKSFRLAYGTEARLKAEGVASEAEHDYRSMTKEKPGNSPNMIIVGCIFNRGPVHIPA